MSLLVCVLLFPVCQRLLESHYTETSLLHTTMCRRRHESPSLSQSFVFFESHRWTSAFEYGTRTTKGRVSDIVVRRPVPCQLHLRRSWDRVSVQRSTQNVPGETEPGGGLCTLWSLTENGDPRWFESVNHNDREFPPVDQLGSV